MVVAPPALDQPARGLGLDAAALRAALGRLVGHRRPRRPARRSPPGPAPSTARARCCSTRCTRSPRCRRSSRRPYTPSSRRFGTPLALRITDLTAYARADPADPGRGRRAAPGDRRRPDRARPGVGGQARRARAAVAVRGPPRAPRRRRRPAGSSPRSARWPSATAGTGAGGRRRCADPDAPGGRRGPSRAGPAGRLPRLAAAAGAAAARRGPGGGPGGRRPRDRTTWPSAATRRAPTAGRCRTCSPAACGSGAPPDAFSQQGQDWGLPPWRPDRLAATGYAAYRDLLRALLRQADGLRIDHVAGLWRLWWVPPGESAGPRHLRALRRRGDARRAHPGGAPGRRAGDRRGPGHGRARGHGRAGRAQHARLARCSGSPATTTPPGAAAAAPARAGRRSRWPPSPPTTCRPCSASCAASTSGPAPSWACSTTWPRRRRRPRPTGPSWSSCCGRRAWSRATEPGEDELVRGRARAAGPGPLPAGPGLALRRRRRDPPAQPARHRRPVPELAAAAAGVARGAARAIPASARSPTAPPAPPRRPPSLRIDRRRRCRSMRGGHHGLHARRRREWIGGCGRSG